MDEYAHNIDIQIVEYDDRAIVAVEGEVDLSAASLFEESLVIAGATDARAIILDLDRVSFMDSAGVHVLLQFSISDSNRERLSVTRGSSQVRRLLELTGVRRYLSVLRAPAPAHNGDRAPNARLRLTRP
jgi:anti-sigma B factor antagonist